MKKLKQSEQDKAHGHRQSEQGFMAIEALGALLVLLIMLPLLSSLWQAGMNTVKKRAVAEHFMQVEKAARQYVKLNYNSLQAATTATTGPSVSLADLKNSGCLPNQVNALNPWGQGYQLFARKDKNGEPIMVVLTSGGRGHSATEPDFANILVPEAAALAKAGFIPTGTVNNAGVLRGAYGGWEVTLASLGVTGTAGHLGMVSSLSADETGKDYLYRVEVPGMPELNAMQTDLDLNGNDIEGVKSITYDPQPYDGAFCTKPEDEGKTFLKADSGMYLCRNGQTTLISDSGNSLPMKTAHVAANLELIDKPVCPQGTNSHPEIFVAPAIASAGAQSQTLASFQTWATEYSANQWQIQMRVLTADNQWVYPTANYGRAMVFTSCAKN